MHTLPQLAHSTVTLHSTPSAGMAWHTARTSQSRRRTDTTTTTTRMAWQAHNGKCLHAVRPFVRSFLSPSGLNGAEWRKAEMITRRPDSPLLLRVMPLSNRGRIPKRISFPFQREGRMNRKFICTLYFSAPLSFFSQHFQTPPRPLCAPSLSALKIGRNYGSTSAYS